MSMRKKSVSRLRAMRKERGLTLMELSAKTDIPSSTIAALEVGAGERFSLTLKRTLADFYGVQIVELFPEEDARAAEILGDRRKRVQGGPIKAGADADPEYDLIERISSRLAAATAIIVQDELRRGGRGEGTT